MVSASGSGNEAGTRVAALFPGQGAQKVGMAGELVQRSGNAKRVFDVASDIVGYDLLKVCRDGPQDELDRTEVSQPAIYAASVAALEALKEEGREQASQVEAAEKAVGLSLGEYTALTFAGALGLEDGLKLVKERGEAMQEAAEANPGGMASVVGLQLDDAQELAAKAQEQAGSNAILRVANVLCPGNYTLSGSTDALDKAEELAKGEFQAKRFVRLPVAGAFHTPLMQPAADRLKQALDGADIRAPCVPVLANATAGEHDSPESVRELLQMQLTSPVRFEECIRSLLSDGFGDCFEIGPGNVIAGLMRRFQPPASVTSVPA